MARMIPDFWDEHTPASERRLFQRLKADPDASDWTVFHSLALTHRGSKPYGEIDFVVLIPGEGVLCVEVKGGRVTCEGGTWFTTNWAGKKSRLSRSPFQQAREGMFALRNAVKRKFGEDHPASRLVFASCVVFTDVVAPPQTPEREEWEAIDIEGLRQPPSRVLSRAVRLQAGRLGRDGARGLTTPQLLSELCSFLRPDFELVVTRSTTLDRSEDRLASLTRDQFEVLDALEANPRCVVEGAAGTGKTMLAVEQARRLSRAGNRVLLLCFNRLLGSWLRDELASEKSVHAGTFHQFLNGVVASSGYHDECEARREPRTAYFEEVLPFFGQLSMESLGPTFDVLLLDEAQDLIRAPYLGALDGAVVGGLASGSWALFGDFHRQALFHEGTEWGGLAAARQELVGFADHFSVVPLRRNCRNTSKIAEETAVLSGFTTLPYLIDDRPALPVDYRYYRGADQQESQLRSVVTEFLADGVKPESIVVLSSVTYERSVALRFRATDDFRILPLESVSERTRVATLRFSTIQAFKGMESPAVIIADVDDAESERAHSLLYTSMSRAKSLLAVLIDTGLRSYVSRAFETRLEHGLEERAAPT